ncbi:MAG TPA: protoheme IX farnesyltransferase [Candidatus Paceibacterota bacterium]|nr:protoheme IX farnesyltransferase [Candidatus Paceibacterota bacterium]
MPTLISSYYRLAKPRMVYMNVAVAAAAFIFGSHGVVDWKAFAAMVLGLACIVASACVFNNYSDRFIDAKMERTQKRALPSGSIVSAHALVFGFALLAVGILLMLPLDMRSLDMALIGFVVYVLIYTPLKPRTGLALFPGAVAGAMPPVVGYVAAAHALDMTALWLFAILFVWQLPHFLAIARYRYDEYANAGVPLLVRRPQNDKQRRRARIVFYISLVVLLIVCGALISAGLFI